MWIVLALAVAYVVCCGACLALKCAENHHGPLPLGEFLLCISPLGAGMGILISVLAPPVFLIAVLVLACRWLANKTNVHPILWLKRRVHIHKPNWMRLPDAVHDILPNEVLVCRWYKRRDKSTA